MIDTKMEGEMGNRLFPDVAQKGSRLQCWRMRVKGIKWERQTGNPRNALEHDSNCR